MDLLERVWGLLTGMKWVHTSHSYRLAGPPRSFSSAEVTVGKGVVVPVGDADKALEELKEEVRKDCVKQAPDVMDTLYDLVEEHVHEESR